MIKGVKKTFKGLNDCLYCWQERSKIAKHVLECSGVMKKLLFAVKVRSGLFLQLISITRHAINFMVYGFRRTAKLSSIRDWKLMHGITNGTAIKNRSTTFTSFSLKGK